MRIPTIRFRGDERPIAWWEWLFYPFVLAVAIPLLFIAAGLSIPYFTVYPERHATEYDFGTERQQEIMLRYREFASRVSIWRRCGRVLAFPFRRKRNWRSKSLRRTP